MDENEKMAAMAINVIVLFALILEKINEKS